MLYHLSDHLAVYCNAIRSVWKILLSLLRFLIRENKASQLASSGYFQNRHRHNVSKMQTVCQTAKEDIRFPSVYYFKWEPQKNQRFFVSQLERFSYVRIQRPYEIRNQMVPKQMV
jgi:hypothetical protein